MDTGWDTSEETLSRAYGKVVDDAGTREFEAKMKTSLKWVVQLSFHNKGFVMGTFDTKEECEAFRDTFDNYMTEEIKLMEAPPVELEFIAVFPERLTIPRRKTLSSKQMQTVEQYLAEKYGVNI